MAVNLAYKFMVINAVISTWAVLVVVARFLARYYGRNMSYGLDDALIVVAAAFLVALTQNAIQLYKNGGSDGTPFEQLPASSQMVFFQCFYASELLYYFVMLPTKLAILAFYNRIFSLGTGSVFRLLLKVTAVTCIVWFVALLIPTVVQCQPLDHIWNKSVHGTCLDLDMLYSAVTISNFVINNVILVLPIYRVVTLRAPVAVRVASCVILALGASACVSSAFRIWAGYHFKYDRENLILACTLWTCLEPALAIFSACLPDLNPLLPGRLGRVLAGRDNTVTEPLFVGNTSRAHRLSLPPQESIPMRAINRRWSGVTAAAHTDTGETSDHPASRSYSCPAGYNTWELSSRPHPAYGYHAFLIESATSDAGFHGPSPALQGPTADDPSPSVNEDSVLEV